MAINFTELEELMNREGYRFLIDPSRPVIQFGVRGTFGTYDSVLRLDCDGQFLQFRSLRYLNCPADHPHLPVVLRLLATLNYNTRLLKFGWDEADGEIAAYADIWLMDSKITQQQFSRMLANFLPVIDQVCPRIKLALETGKDPGEAASQKVPPEIQKLIDELQKKKADSPGTDEKSKPGEGPAEI